MLRLLIDQDLDQVILRGLLLRVPGLDVVTAHQAGLSNASDSDLLAWAAQESRVVISHDRKTMPVHAANRIALGQMVTGLIIVSRRLRVSMVIDDLEIIVSCSEESDWQNTIMHMPL